MNKKQVFRHTPAFRTPPGTPKVMRRKGTLPTSDMPRMDRGTRAGYIRVFLRKRGTRLVRHRNCHRRKVRGVRHRNERPPRLISSIFASPEPRKSAKFSKLYPVFTQSVEMLRRRALRLPRRCAGKRRARGGIRAHKGDVRPHPRARGGRTRLFRPHPMSGDHGQTGADRHRGRGRRGCARWVTTSIPASISDTSTRSTAARSKPRPTSNSSSKS